MTAQQVIELCSKSGKWKHTTTTDDPLFSPLLGGMVEAGLELPRQLVIEGATGEILEQAWEYVLQLQECVEAGTRPEPYISRRDVEQVSHILELPRGWQMYTILDSTYSLEERIRYSSECRECIGEKIHTPQGMWINDVSLELTRGGMTIGLRVAWSSQSMSDMLRDLGLFFLPFYRNVWLQHKSADTLTTIDEVDWPVVHACLEKLDWPSIAKDEGVHEIYLRLKRVSDFFNGYPAEIPAVIAFNERTSIDPSLLSRVYYKMLGLRSYASNTSFLGLGLLIYNRTYYIGRSHPNGDVPLSELVGYVNSRIITRYLGTTEATIEAWRTESVEALSPYYMLAMKVLAEKVGLYPLRRIQASLQETIKQNEEVINLDIVRITTRMRKLLQAVEYYLTREAPERVEAIIL